MLPELPAAVSVAAGISLRTEVSGYDAESLRKIIRQLDRYARKAKLKHSPDDLEIVCVENGKFRYTGRYLYIPGSAAQWHDDFALRRQLYGVLASHRFNYRYPADSAGVAPWIACALDAELSSAETSGQFLVSNRGYWLLSEFAACHDALPDFGAFCLVGHQTRDAALHDLSSEQGRILLHILSAGGKIGELFSGSCAGGKPDEFLKFFSSRANAQDVLSTAALPLLWNRSHPMPASAALKQLPQLEKITLQQVDSEMRPTGEFKEYSLQEFVRLMESERPDKRKLQESFARKFVLFGKMLNAEENRICGELSSMIFNLGHGGREEDFSRRFAALSRMLKKRAKAEKYLNSVLLVNVPLPDNLYRLFVAAQPDSLAGSEAEKEFLLRVMNEYLE